MAKITRKSYKRKKVVLGVTLFASIALISTGFAAWVISQGAENKPDGSINIGTVKDGAVSFIGVEQDKNEFVFDCLKTDTTGRVYYEDEAGKGGESLSVTVSGYITNPQYFSSLSVTMTVPKTVKDAVAKQYIVLPECATKVVDLTDSVTDYAVKDSDTTLIEAGYESGSTLKHFEYKISFKWGSAFALEGGEPENPGLYFDEPSIVSSVTLDEVKNIMNDLHDLLNTKEKYEITLIATARS